MPNEKDFYQQLRERIKTWLASKEGAASEWAEYLMLAPDLFHLMWKLSGDDEVPKTEKVKLAIAIAYFISPIDLIPEAIVGPVGYVDDIALAAYVLNGLVNKTDPALLSKHWAGDGNALEVIRKVLQAAEKMVGSGIWNKLIKRIG